VAKKAEPLDPKSPLGKFMGAVKKTVDTSRLDKASKMLRAERFQLFADVKPELVVGVVKSQTDASLVYSCMLASDGRFSCCTQNLFPCGGLRGAPCKHLLVLTIGLVKSGQLDAEDAEDWMKASRNQEPKIEKDLMSETFLRYKGAESGTVDWRPTETIPEDYYAL
jgi:hypothetical protein